MYLMSGLKDFTTFFQETPPLVAVTALLAVGLVWVTVQWRTDVKTYRADAEKLREDMVRQDVDYNSLRADYKELVEKSQGTIDAVNQQFFSLVQSFVKIGPEDRSALEKREPEDVVKAIVGTDDPDAGGEVK